MELYVNDEKLQLHLTDTTKFHIKELEKYTYQINLKLFKMKYEITEEQIKKLAKGNAKIKKMFPDVFETKLEVGKWYKSIDKPLHIFYVTELKDNRYYYYGFNTLGFFEKEDWFSFIHCGLQKGFKPATDSEVLEALTNEANKRGFKRGVCFNIVNGERNPIHIDKNERYGFDNYGNKLLMNNWCIFENGIWATPIKTYTKEEAEKMLNAKII